MKKLILLGLSLISISGFSQTFQKTMFSPGEDLNHFNIEKTADGNYIIGGDYFNSVGDAKYYVSKVDPNGGTIWSTNIDILSEGRLLDVAEDNQGDIILTGYRTTNGKEELYVAKLDNAGILVNDFSIDSFDKSTGTNIIYSAATDSYIIGGFKSSSFSWSLTNNEAIILELDKGLNLMWIQSLMGYSSSRSSINDIIETPNGYFVTGSVSFNTGSPFFTTLQGVMAVFVDISGNLVNDLSFQATNDRHTGVSAFYDNMNDEVFMVSNSSFYHNPVITKISNVSSTPIINYSFYIRLDPTFGSYNAGAFKIEADPNRPNELTLCGYYRTPKNNSTTWYLNALKSGGSISNVMLYTAPAGSFSSHGGGLLSTFVSEHPYIYNQEIMTTRQDGQGIIFLAPREYNGDYAVDLVSTSSYWNTLDCEAVDTARHIFIPEYGINCNVNPIPATYVNPMHVNTPRLLDEIHLCEVVGDAGRRLKSTDESTFGNDLKVYPNPSNGDFNISFEAEKFTQLIVRDLTGRVIKEINITNEESKILLDLSEEATGIYLVTAIGNSTQKTLKISKQ